MISDAGLVRNRRKIESSIENARAYLEIARTYGSFSQWIWAYVDGRPIVTHRPRGEALPTSTELSTRIGKDLHARGFRFVGPTIVYSYLQAVGIVDDHSADCFRAEASAK